MLVDTEAQVLDKCKVAKRKTSLSMSLEGSQKNGIGQRILVKSSPKRTRGSISCIHLQLHPLIKTFSEN